MVQGVPVVVSSNGKGLPVKQVTKNAPLMTVSPNGKGLPIVLSNNGAPFVVQGLFTNLIVNGDFENGTANWLNFSPPQKTVAGGAAVFTSGIPYDGIEQIISALSTNTGKYFELTFTVSVTSGVFRARFIDGTGQYFSDRPSSGTFTERKQALTGNTKLSLIPSDAGFTGTVDNVVMTGPYNTATIGGS